MPKINRKHRRFRIEGRELAYINVGPVRHRQVGHDPICKRIHFFLVQVMRSSKEDRAIIITNDGGSDQAVERFVLQGIQHPVLRNLVNRNLSGSFN